MQPIFLKVEEVLSLHVEQLLRYGGSAGVRGQNALESAIQMPFSGMGDFYFHEDLAAMAGAYLFHIIKNHPFVDGNKRTGLNAALVFLRLNGFRLETSNDALVDIVVNLASGSVSKEEVSQFIRDRLKPVTT